MENVQRINKQKADAREVQNRINAQSARQAGKPHDRFDEKDSTPNQRNQWIERGVLMVAGVLLGVVATFTLGGTLHSCTDRAT